MEIAAMRAVLCVEFNHSSKLKIMKFKAAMNGPDNDKWKDKIKNEHARMVINGVWEVLNKKDLPEGAEVMTSMSTCKKTMKH